MKKEILNIAKLKFNQLFKQYNGFINIFIDNWRGYRFVFDTKDVRQCNNNCVDCPLFKILKKEKEGVFSSGLYPTSANDKKLFGQQNFLNCKTIEQYQDCYISFLLEKCNSKKEIYAELDLVKNVRVIYSYYGKAKLVEINFKNYIKTEVLKLADAKKKKIILRYFVERGDF